MNKGKRVRASLEPKGAPVLAINGWERTPLTPMEISRSLWKLDVQDTRDGENLDVGNFGKRSACQTRSKALEMLSRTRRDSL